MSCSCGKILRSELDAQVCSGVAIMLCVARLLFYALTFFLTQAHAARTSHQNFAESTEEIKPLTAEEKKAQLAK